MLAWKNEQSILKPYGVQVAPDRFVECGELEARDHGAEGRVERFDVKCACHTGSPIDLKVNDLTRGYRNDR
jgi:hypothetical protein